MKERPVHGVIVTETDLHIACHHNRGVKSGWAHTLHSDLPLFAVTCKNCLRVLRCGTQMTLVLK